MGGQAPTPRKRGDPDSRRTFGGSGARLGATTRLGLRRGGYALFTLAGLSVIIAIAVFASAIIGSTDKSSGFLAYGMVQFGFAVITGVLGLVLLTGSRRPG